MNKLPFELPQSIATYAERFENDPVKATKRLEKQLEKRDPDAVGHFLLAWFYYQQGNRQQAVEESLKAKVYAPGSPFFEKLHYYFVHPNMFDAWTPDTPETDTPQVKRSDQKGPILDLDNLIQQISAVNKDAMHQQSEEASKKKDITSKTLANIHAKQGNIEAAITMYEQLKGKNPEEKSSYDSEIKKLQELKQEQEKTDS